MVTDPLTGVYSRATLEQRLHEETQRAQRYGTPFSIILLDLDHYKSVNDAFGHLRGDKVLVEFAQRLNTLTRKSDVIFRYGGDEFLLLLPNTVKSQAILLAERLLDGIRGQPFRGKPPLALSISLGVASFPDDAHSPEALFEKADQRHYEAKRRGRGRAVAEDREKAPPLPFDDEARLVERDEALLVLHHFLKDLPDKKRGIMAVTGPAGSGRSRFLSEIGKVARLQGFEVISIHGSPALKNRTFGDLAEVCKNNYETLPPPMVGEVEFGRALQRLVEEKGRSGLIFTVENLPQIDWSSLELIRYLLLSPEPPILIGLAFSADPGSARRIFPAHMPLIETIELGALSPEGFHIWMRLLMQWEAPSDFTEWLYHQTGGLPGYLQKALIDLIERNFLEKDRAGWVVNPNYATLSLADRLGLQTALPAYSLPAMPTSFVGRETEISEAKRFLAESRLLTLVGPGGVGKTRLALQIAAELLDEYLNAVCWVPLASVSSSSLLVSTIAEALKFSFYHRSDPETQLFNYLRSRRMLLVMDNFEHLTQGAELLARILENAPEVKLLVTSRERLNLRGEMVLELQGMKFPPENFSERIESYAAVQLFVQSARRSYPNFLLDEWSKPHVARICNLLEGLPLGIELAASWVHILSCEEISQEIEQNLDFLMTHMWDVPERHRSMRAVFEHSWNLLLGEEKEVLRRIAVFEGGFRREAAAKVAEGSLFHLSILVEKSLLRRAANGRYEMHEVLRHYAALKLNQDAEVHLRTHHRHCEYFAVLLQEKATQIKGERQREGLQSIGEEIKNVRAAWAWAVEHWLIDRIEQLLDSLFEFYEIRGLLQEGEQAFQRAANSVKPKSGPISDLPDHERALLGKLLARRGVFNHRLSNYEQARYFFEQSLKICRELDDRQEMAFVLLKLGMLEEEMGEYEQARRACQESLLLYREVADLYGIGRALNELGEIAYQQGEYQTAENYHRESLRLFRETNDRWGQASALKNLGNVEVELGEYFQAKLFYQESLAIGEEIGAKSILASAYNNLGDTAREIGEYEEAREHLLRSLDISTEIGDRYIMAVSLGNLGEVAYRQGKLSEAQFLLDQSLQISEATGNLSQASFALAHLGNVTCAAGDHITAKKHFQNALRLAMNKQAVPIALDVILGMANILNQTGLKAKALEYLVYSLNHPALMKSQREQALHLRHLLEDELPPDAIQEAQERGQLRPIDEVVDEILEKDTPTLFV